MADVPGSGNGHSAGARKNIKSESRLMKLEPEKVAVWGRERHSTLSAISGER